MLKLLVRTKRCAVTEYEYSIVVHHLYRPKKRIDYKRYKAVAFKDCIAALEPRNDPTHTPRNLGGKRKSARKREYAINE